MPSGSLSFCKQSIKIVLNRQMSVRYHSILNLSYQFVLIMNKQELFQQQGFRNFYCFQIIILFGGGTLHRLRGNFFRFCDSILTIPNGWFVEGGKKKRRLRHWDREVRNSFELVSKEIKAVILFRGQCRLIFSACNLFRLMNPDQQKVVFENTPRP